MTTRRFRKAVEAVRRMVEEHGCLMMKIATEDEALTHEDVEERQEAFGSILPIELKIGGPGARGDLALCRRLGIRHMIAPMIESAYGMQDYLSGVAEVFPESIRHPRRLHLGVNIETGRAARDVAAILDADPSHRLAQVTVGRGDLSKSIGAKPDDAPVMALAASVVKAARRRVYLVSIGGGIDGGNAATIRKRLAPDFINTRNFAFAAKEGNPDDLAEAVRAALRAEIEILAAAGGRLAKARIRALKERLSA